MTMITENSEEWIAEISALAVSAGNIAMDYFGKEVAFSEKSDHSPVTLADCAIEKVLLEGIKKTLGNIQIISEEANGTSLPTTLEESFFLLDPLDGTRHFINGEKEFTVNIGLIENSTPVMGIVYAPALGDIFIADTKTAKHGICQSGQKFSMDDMNPISTRNGDKKQLVMVTSQSHHSPESDNMAARLAVSQRMRFGSSLKFCRIAQGKADFYPRFGRTMEWDSAAAHAIINAAGGTVLDMKGNPLRYGKLEQGLANPHFLALGDKALTSHILQEKEK